MKLLTIIGNRPQLMKVDKQLKQVIVWTGQHFDKLMKDSFFKDLKLPKPKYDLKETRIGAMIDKLIEVIKKENPDYVLVYGDTNSSLAGAIAAKQCKIKLIHVEAGMRSRNMEMIEENNRIMIDHVSDYLLCPSKNSADNLEKENVSGMIGVSGNVMIDTLFSMFPTKKNNLGEYYLLTLHRAETVDNKKKLKEVITALGKTGVNIIFPCHPRTSKRLNEFKINIPENIKLIDPVGYKEMVNLIGNAKKVLTDSGGLQAEAHFMAVPCITLREETEWVETLRDGNNVLVGTDADSIISAVLDKKTITSREFIYGKGDAKDKIRNFIKTL